MTADPTIRIRRLAPGDVVDMRALNAVFAEAFEDPDQYAADLDDDAWLAETLGLPHVTVLVAEDGGRVVAGLTAYDLHKLERRRIETYIYDIAVLETHRRRGVATALIRRLGEIAGARGAWVMFVQADHGDEPAIALYDSLGTREEVLHFDIPVAGGRPKEG